MKFKKPLFIFGLLICTQFISAQSFFDDGMTTNSNEISLNLLPLANGEASLNYSRVGRYLSLDLTAGKTFNYYTTLVSHELTPSPPNSGIIIAPLKTNLKEAISQSNGGYCWGAGLAINIKTNLNIKPFYSLNFKQRTYSIKDTKSDFSIYLININLGLKKYFLNNIVIEPSIGYGTILGKYIINNTNYSHEFINFNFNTNLKLGYAF